MLSRFNVFVGDREYALHTSMSESEIKRCYVQAVQLIGYDFCQIVCDVQGDSRIGPYIAQKLIKAGIISAAGRELDMNLPTVITKAMFLDIWKQMVQLGARRLAIPETMILSDPETTFYIGGWGAVDGVLE